MATEGVKRYVVEYDDPGDTHTLFDLAADLAASRTVGVRVGHEGEPTMIPVLDASLDFVYEPGKVVRVSLDSEGKVKVRTMCDGE